MFALTITIGDKHTLREGDVASIYENRYTSIHTVYSRLRKNNLSLEKMSFIVISFRIKITLKSKFHANIIGLVYRIRFIFDIFISVITVNIECQYENTISFKYNFPIYFIHKSKIAIESQYQSINQIILIDTCKIVWFKV